MEELLEATFSVWSVPGLHKQLILHCEKFNLEASQELTAEVGGWQLAVGSQSSP
jgi:hypothetical protein